MQKNRLSAIYPSLSPDDIIGKAWRQEPRMGGVFTAVLPTQESPSGSTLIQGGRRLTDGLGENVYLLHGKDPVASQTLPRLPARKPPVILSCTVGDPCDLTNGEIAARNFNKSVIAVDPKLNQAKVNLGKNGATFVTALVQEPDGSWVRRVIPNAEAYKMISPAGVTSEVSESFLAKLNKMTPKKVNLPENKVIPKTYDSPKLCAGFVVEGSAALSGGVLAHLLTEIALSEAGVSKRDRFLPTAAASHVGSCFGSAVYARVVSGIAMRASMRALLTNPVGITCAVIGTTVTAVADPDNRENLIHSKFNGTNPRTANPEELEKIIEDISYYTQF